MRLRSSFIASPIVFYFCNRRRKERKVAAVTKFSIGERWEGGLRLGFSKNVSKKLENKQPSLSNFFLFYFLAFFLIIAFYSFFFKLQPYPWPLSSVEAAADGLWRTVICVCFATDWAFEFWFALLWKRWFFFFFFSLWMLGIWGRKRQNYCITQFTYKVDCILKLNHYSIFLISFY